jgi:hypothetical protein
MLEKGFQQVLSTVLGNERVGDFLSEGVDIMRHEVGHLAVCGMSPGVIDDSEFGRISREALDVDLVPLDISQQTRGLFVPTEAVPDQE